MEPQQETRDEKPLTFADIGIPTGPKLEEGALGKVKLQPVYESLNGDVSRCIVQSSLCKSCAPLWGQLKGQKGQPNIWASCEKISWNFIYSFDIWVAPTVGNQNSQQKRISNVK